MLWNTFFRNVIYTTLWILFFWFLLFWNLEMIFAQESILTQLWIPNFVGWLFPGVYFLLLGLFLMLQIRCIYNKKRSKKNLRSLHLFIAIFYGFFSLILLFLLLFWLNELFPIFSIFVALGLRNYYIYYRLQTKTYIWNFEPKDFFYSYTIVLFIIFSALFVFSRNVIPNIYSQNTDIYQSSLNHSGETAVEIVKKPVIDQYLESLALKEDPHADYEVIVYNLQVKYYHTLEYILEQTKNINFQNSNIQYDYNNLILIQKINLLKYQYHALHKENIQAKNTITEILKLNNALIQHSKSYIDIKAFMNIQNYTLDSYEKYKNIFSADEITEINSYLQEINIDVLWEHLIKNEFAYKMKQYDYLYNIPLLINKDQMKNLEYYYYIQKLEEPLNPIDRVSAKIYRSNYFWTLLTQLNTYPNKSEYFNLEILEQRIIDLKK